MECFRESVSAPFSLRGKEKAAGGKKKTAKGDFPLCNPLKRPRRGLWPPSLDHPRGLVCAETDSDLQNALQMRIWQTGMVVEIRYVCFGRDLNGSSFVRDMHGRACCAAALRLPYVKYSTGANETTRTAYRALRKPDWAAARRAF